MGRWGARSSPRSARGQQGEREEAGGVDAPSQRTKGLQRPQNAVYLRIMDPRDLPGCAKGLLEFRPWMLALAVFLACALGIAVMEQFRDGRAIWAQVTQQEAPSK
jgi:hypothetical protein